MTSSQKHRTMPHKVTPPRRKPARVTPSCTRASRVSMVDSLLADGGQVLLDRQFTHGGHRVRGLVDAQLPDTVGDEGIQTLGVFRCEFGRLHAGFVQRLPL